MKYSPTIPELNRAVTFQQVPDKEFCRIMTTGCYSKFFSEDVLPSCNNARGLSWYDDMNKGLDSRTAVPLSTKCPVDIKKHVVKKKMQNFGRQPSGGVFL